MKSISRMTAVGLFLALSVSTANAQTVGQSACDYLREATILYRTLHDAGYSKSEAQAEVDTLLAEFPLYWRIRDSLKPFKEKAYSPLYRKLSSQQLGDLIYANCMIQAGRL